MADYHKGKLALFHQWLPDGIGCLLDIGCASSFMVSCLSSKSRFSFGIDLDFPKLVNAKVQYPGVDYINGIGEALPFRNETMDAITFFETLEHVDDELLFLNEIHRVLKISGIIMFSVPNHGFIAFFDIDNIFFRPILYLAKKLKIYTNFDDYHLKHHKNYSIEKIQTFLDGRFKITDVYYGGLIFNRIAFLFYKIIYVLLLLFKCNKKNKLFKKLHDWMDGVTSWDFDHNYGRKSDKLCIFARKI